MAEDGQSRTMKMSLLQLLLLWGTSRDRREKTKDITTHSVGPCGNKIEESCNHQKMNCPFPTLSVLPYSWRIAVFLFLDILSLYEWLKCTVVRWCLTSYWCRKGCTKHEVALLKPHTGSCKAYFYTPVPTPEQTLSKHWLKLRNNRLKLLLNRPLYPFLESWSNNPMVSNSFMWE